MRGRGRRSYVENSASILNPDPKSGTLKGYPPLLGESI